jgi:hypothetical protein
MTEKPDTSEGVRRKGATLHVLPARKRALSDAHREHLRASGLTDESIDLGGFYTERDPASIAAILHWTSWPRGRGDVLVIPFSLPGQPEPFFSRVRPDSPRTNKDTEKVIKYEQPKATPMAPYFAARARANGWLADTSKPLVLTEGEKKAALLDQLGFASIGATGVACFHDAGFRRDEGEYRLHELIRKHVTVKGRECFIAFDSDSKDNENVSRAADVLAAMLRAEGASDVRMLSIPAEKDQKLGIDDFFARFGESKTRELFGTAESVQGNLGRSAHVLLSSFRALAGAPLPEKLRMPQGYDLGKGGELTRYDEKSHGQVPVERAGLFVSRFVADLYTGNENVELVFKRADVWRRVVVARKAIADSRTLVSDLAPLGAPVDSNTASDMVRWLRDFESANETRIPRSTSVGRCGWHTVENADVFALGSEVHAAAGECDVLVERGGDRGRLFRGLKTKGNIEAALSALRDAWTASPIAAAAICASLAAPLLKPLGAPLFAMHLAGDSSRGKSSMLKLAASIYGDPRDEEWVASWNSTSVGLEVRAAMLSDLPLCIDEAGVVDAKDREKAVYMLVNGVGRTRGAKDGGLREGHSWRTVVLSTGESRLVTEESATGAQVRVLDLAVDGFGKLTAAGVDALVRSCVENYGVVGAQWLKALVSVDADAWADERDRLRTRTKAFADRAATGSLAARQSAFWALLAHVEAIAFEELGIGIEGGASMARLFAEQSDPKKALMREARTASDRAIDVVREWMIRDGAKFPRLDINPAGKKVPKFSGGGREVAGYIDQDRGLLVVPGALREALARSGISDAVVLRDWRQRGLIDCDEGVMSKTVRIDGAKVRVIAIGCETMGIEPASEEFGNA